MQMLVLCVSSGKMLTFSAHLLSELFAFLILNCMSYLYILDINPLLELSLVKISHSVCFLFVLLLASFTVQKLLSTISSYLFFLEETFFKKYC